MRSRQTQMITLQRLHCVWGNKLTRKKRGNDSQETTRQAGRTCACKMWRTSPRHANFIKEEKQSFNIYLLNSAQVPYPLLSIISHPRLRQRTPGFEPLLLWALDTCSSRVRAQQQQQCEFTPVGADSHDYSSSCWCGCPCALQRASSQLD